MVDEPDGKHKPSVTKEVELHELKGLQDHLDAEKSRLKADEERLRAAANLDRDAAARERDAAARERDAAARERSTLDSEAVRLENEKQELAAKAKLLEKTETPVGDANGAQPPEKPPEPTASELTAKAKKDLRVAVDMHRRRYERGRRIWRTLVVVSVHLISFLVASAIFVWKSNVVFQSASPASTELYRADIVFGAIMLAVILLILLLEYLRNWHNCKRTLTKLDKIAVDLTEPTADLSTIRTNLKTALDEHVNSFIQRRS